MQELIGFDNNPLNSRNQYIRFIDDIGQEHLSIVSYYRIRYGRARGQKYKDEKTGETGVITSIYYD